jgi:molybdopterin-guanine dinucleotide biosynthesis protein A
VVGGLGDGEEICVPVVGRGWQPLAAAYRTSVLAVVEELLGADDLRVSRLFDRCRVTRLDRDALLADAGVANGDPDLESVVNINDPAAYAAARERPAPAISLRWGRRGDGEPQAGRHASTVRAATLGGVADVLEIELDEVSASVNGVAAGTDRELPLERGDAVVFTRMMR